MMTSEWCLKQYKIYKEQSLNGRWIRFSSIEPLLKKWQETLSLQQIGNSENNSPIYSISFGSGEKKILMWSQMHGNESTGTKALFDLFNLLVEGVNLDIIDTILTECTILCIPMLNPDGAEKYTRVNANGIDLNRDAVARSAKESQLLRNILDDFKPDFCFNLHDQRTIFGVEGTRNPATISFLAPSVDETRALTEGRIQTMDVIVAMNDLLQQIIPNHVGRYTDEFYPTATGDNFQKLGYNTILIESGHYYNDYQREHTREFTFYSLLKGLYHIASNDTFTNYSPYFNIPNNDKLFYDVIHRYKDADKTEAYQYQEQILDNRFVLNLQKVDDLDVNDKIGHNEIVFETA